MAAKKRTQTRDPLDRAGQTPKAVLRAFEPDTEFALDMATVLLLEAIGSPFIKGNGDAGIRDILLAFLCMTDPDGVRAARRKNRLEDFLHERMTGVSPAALVEIAPNIEAAVNAAFDPLKEVAGTDEKKSFPR